MEEEEREEGEEDCQLYAYGAEHVAHSARGWQKATIELAAAGCVETGSPKGFPETRGRSPRLKPAAAGCVETKKEGPRNARPFFYI